MFPSRSELIRVATREFIIKELEAAKKFAEFQEQSIFTPEYPKKKTEKTEEFEVDIDGILGLYPRKETESDKKDERMSADIKYKTAFQMDFQKVPTMELPIENSGSVVDLGDNRLKIDGKVFNLK